LAPEVSKKKQPKSDLDEFIEKESHATSGDVPYDVEMLRDEVRRLRKRLRAGMGNADVIDRAVRELLSANPPKLRPIVAPRHDRRTKHEEIAVLHYSDPQFGKVTSSYDSAVASARAEMLAQKTVLITNVRRSAAPVREIHLYLGGDIVEGELIFPGQAHLIDSPLIELACAVAPMAIARMIRLFLENFESVKVIAVPGNHGRDSRHADPRTNWDMVACRVAKLMLSIDGELPPRLSFDIPGHFYVVDRVFDWGNLVVHGHQINGGFAGFPWYGVGKKAAGWADTIKDPWDYLWFGHFHTYTSGSLNHRQFLANGTTESDNEYALEQLAAAGHPCQRLAFFTAEHGLINDNQVWLTSTRKSQAGRWKEWAASKG
jgi:hypothetical protein